MSSLIRKARHDGRVLGEEKPQGLAGQHGLVDGPPSPEAAEDPDEAVTAWEELGGAARTWKEVREARRQQARPKTFSQARDEVLGAVWESVSKRFSELYCSVHSEDESTFHAELGPKGAGLDLKVDFYGHGKQGFSERSSLSDTLAIR